MFINIHEYANEKIFIKDHKMKDCLYDVFLCFSPYFPLIFKVFININEYKNKIICIFDHGMNILQSLLPFI